MGAGSVSVGRRRGRGPESRKNPVTSGAVALLEHVRAEVGCTHAGPGVPSPPGGAAPLPATRRTAPMTSPEELRALALRELGPASADALGSAEAAAAFDALLRPGGDPSSEHDPGRVDALLHLAFGVAKKNRVVQGEFLAHFRRLLFGPSAEDAPDASPLRALERTDLLQSVIGDLLPAFDELYFESRPQFLRLLRKRLRWKELDRLKRERPEAVTHEELLALEASLRDDHRVAEPLSALLRTEDEARVIAALHGLNESDRRLLRAELDGEDRAALAQELGVSLETLRQRIRRARVALMKAMAPEGGR